MNVNFRETSNLDLERIRELSKGIYSGADTLVSDFIDWLKSDNWFLFVREIHEGKIVAFIAVELTDGRESLNIRSSRVDEDYRGRGIYKALFRYAVVYVRDMCPKVKYIYRIRLADVRVPDGYEIVKKRGLVVMFCDGMVCKEEVNGNKWKLKYMKWPKFKELYERNEGVSSLFHHEMLEIHCDIFRLNCKANWAVLEERMNTRILLTECVGRNSGSTAVVSLLRLGKYFTNEGIPVTVVNIYGLNKEAVKCHIVKAVSEAMEYIGDRRGLFIFWMERDIMSECVSTLKGLYVCDVVYHESMNLLVGDLNGSVEDIMSE